MWPLRSGASVCLSGFEHHARPLLGTARAPWIRIHTRRGGRIAKPIPESLLITGTVGDWEQWTSMKFPESGEYVFPAGLAPVLIDRAQDAGTYWEPNVWIVHTLG